MDRNSTSALETKLDTIIRLLAAPLVEGKPIAEAAPKLASLGLENSTIAAVCNTKPNVVRTAIGRTRSSKTTMRARKE
jgi:hypothetical protein